MNKVNLDQVRYIKHPAPFVREFRTEAPAPMFRRHFSVDDGLTEAKLFLTAAGIADIYLNGKPVTTDRFIPAFSDYRKTVWYCCYDVTELLMPGNNLAAVMLGNGFFNESLSTPWDFNEADWRDSPKLWFYLEMHYSDRMECVESDCEWLTNLEDSPCRFNEFRMGEIYDCRFAVDWMMPNYDDSNWIHAVFGKNPGGVLRAYDVEPIRETCTYECISMTQNENGAYVFDFGQNMSGYVRINLRQPRGTKIHIVYAEQLEADGTRRDNKLSRFFRDGETQFSELVSDGTPVVWKPCFSYYGFRYVIIDGYEQAPTPGDVEAIFVHQAVRELGNFSCSDLTLNRIYRFAKISTLSNLFNMPTDCPTREKQGWCNDAQASCEQMVQNFDMTRFYEKWMQDIYDAMKPDGDLPGVIPTPGYGYAWGSGPVSTGVLFEIPYRIYQYTGSDKLLREAYPYMIRHLAFLEGKRTPEGLVSHGLDDWALPPHTSKKDSSAVPLEFTCTLLVIKMLRIAQLAAERIMQAKPEEDGRIYSEELRALKDQEKTYTNIFCRNYMLSDGRVIFTEQTALAMVIVLGLYSDLSQVREQFLESMKKYDWHFHVGMLGMQYVLPACDICGLQEEGIRLLSAEGYPSYREWFKNGATTLYEKWVDNESRNHHMYSCPISWFHNTILGLRQDSRFITERKLHISPYFPHALTHAEGDYDTPIGRITVRWRKEKTAVRYFIKLPVGVSADLHHLGSIYHLDDIENEIILLQ
ncbi:MAG: hypothetical protein E7662_03525 [Ruminococcaceae bacterium]|nr:hypothetical protein [Oscillospiraceae bacterium]